jgi:hypothetical protein
MGTLPQVVAVALERGAGPPERHTNCIGVGWLVQHTPPLATQLTRALHTMQVSETLQLLQITHDTLLPTDVISRPINGPEVGSAPGTAFALESINGCHHHHCCLLNCYP